MSKLVCLLNHPFLLWQFSAIHCLEPCLARFFPRNSSICFQTMCVILQLAPIWLVSEKMHERGFVSRSRGWCLILKTSFVYWSFIASSTMLQLCNSALYYHILPLEDILKGSPHCWRMPVINYNFIRSETSKWFDDKKSIKLEVAALWNILISEYILYLLSFWRKVVI